MMNEAKNSRGGEETFEALLRDRECYYFGALHGKVELQLLIQWVLHNIEG